MHTSAKHPKVQLEVSVLGYAAQGATYRTGVFRMVDNWARGLAVRTDIDLTFTSLLDPRTAIRSLHYLRTNTGFERAFLPTIKGGNFLGQVDSTFLELARARDVGPLKKLLRRSLAQPLARWERGKRLDAAETASTADIFHSTYWPFPDGIRSRAGKTRYVMTFVDLINLVNSDLSTDGGAFFKKVLGTVHAEDFTVSISAATRKDLLSVRPDLDPARSFVAPLAASELFRPVGDKAQLKQALSKWNLQPESYLLSVCTLERRKNLPRLLEAFEAWTSHSRNKDITLVLTGAAGNAMEAIQKQLADMKARDRVRLLGFVDDAELAPLYQGAVAFAYPSLHEGFGLPVLEALQCGAVVVTSDNSSLPEVAGDAAVYCDAKNIDSIVQALDTALGSETVRADLRRRALLQASKFSWEKSVDILAGVYSKAMGVSSVDSTSQRASAR